MKFKKSLGQNFLIDNNIIEKIVQLGKINSSSIVLEVGPGTGNLTSEILKKKPKKFYAVEKDKELSLLLMKKFENKKNFIVYNNDILKIDGNDISNNKIIVLGNLPYNISTQLLAKWILLKKWPPWYENLVLMFQKEVADRIIAKCGTKFYGRLSILSNWRLKVFKHFNVSRNCFFPKPNVDSTVLSFCPIKNSKFEYKNPKNLETITRIFFSNRRKMINKPFKKLFKNNIDIKKKLKLDLSLRPDKLDFETYYKLTDIYEKLF